MGHEINQLDISGIQLRESKTQPKVSLSREIGEAKIVHTIFGRAKVRIIRKHDKFHRALWQTAAFVVAVAAALFWQDWYAGQQTDSMQSGESAMSTDAGAQERAPVPQLENVAAPATPQAAVVEPRTLAPDEVGKPAISHGAPQPHAVTKAAENEVAKPAAVQPKRVVTPKPVATKPKPAAPLRATVQTATAGTPPQTPPVSAGENTLKTPTAVPATKPVLPKPPVAATVVTPVSAKPAVPASGAVAAPVLTPPLAKDEPANHAPVVDKQLAAPINMPGK